MTTIRNAEAMRYFIHLFYSFFFICILSVLGPCFVMQYFASYLVLQSSHWGRELVALLILSSRCHVAVISLCRFLKAPSVVCGV